MLPLSLYIHIPWCIQKCPYCDFNSHQKTKNLPEIDYVHALILDLKQDIASFGARPIHSIFIGGGTPSLLSEKTYGILFDALHKLLDLSQVKEITLEANPNSADAKQFKGYRALGINRLSIGVQSFHNRHLKALGRAHDSLTAHAAIHTAHKAGFERINLDIMHSLPHQTKAEALDDLSTALSFKPEHISWYQLTLEPNTIFYKKSPKLPDAEASFHIETEGKALLKANGLLPYEISAFSEPGQASLHNLNYWQFGDYFGIGAGAHGKLSQAELNTVYRTQKMRQPKDYLNLNKSFMAEQKIIDDSARVFEFMLNTTRLNRPIPYQLFAERTGLSIERLLPLLKIASTKQLVACSKTHWQVTDFGRQFTNDLQAIFLMETSC